MEVLSDQLIFPPCFISGLSLWEFGIFCKELERGCSLINMKKAGPKSVNKSSEQNQIQKFLLDYCLRFCVTVVRLNSLYQMRNKLQSPSCDNLSSIYKHRLCPSLTWNPVGFLSHFLFPALIIYWEGYHYTGFPKDFLFAVNLLPGFWQNSVNVFSYIY